MQAAVLTDLKHPLQLWSQIQIPKLNRGQVLVSLAYSGVCHSQLQEARGGRGQDPYLPHLLGHEGTGIVSEIGPDVSKVKVGDKVVLTWIKGQGIEAGGVKYTYEGRTVNAGGVTTFNQQAVVSENRLVKLPNGIGMDIGVLFGCALLTGAGTVLNTIKPDAGTSLAVFGLGGVGLSALIAAQLYPVKMLIAVDVEDQKLELARAFGATHTFNAKTENAVEAIRKLTGGNGVNYSVEAAGSAQTIEQAFACVMKNGGLCVFASHPSSGQKIQLDPYDLICGKQIKGTWGGECKPDRDIPLLAELCVKRKIPLEKLITKKYKLSEINQALDDIEARRVARPLVEIAKELDQ